MIYTRLRTALSSRRTSFALTLIMLCFFVAPDGAHAQGTEFTYQGYLEDNGSPASGSFDLRFILYDSQSGGSQVGSTLTKDDVGVSDGVFNVALDFGSEFGAQRWLEVAVREGTSTGSYTVLSPRSQVRPSPAATALSLPFRKMISSTGSSFTIIQQGSGPGITVSNNGGGYGLRAFTNGSSAAVDASVALGSGDAVSAQIYNNGTGDVLVADHSGASGNIAVFQSSGSNVARIDRNGKGYFDDGTQTGGADVAESFAVEGVATQYEPGDVLVISATQDRTVTRSQKARSTRVVGVYATKPGVLLTEKGIDADLSGQVPMGVLGVIPTKVSTENGPIERGDLLVTASTPGHAMKAESTVVNGVEIYPQGAILGKALERFEGPGTGIIKVLVNAK